MEDQLLFEQFHDEFDIEPRPGSFDRVRSVIIRQESQERAPRHIRHAFPRIGVRLAAAIALVALAVASVGAFVGINEYAHRNVLVRPAPFKVGSPGSAVCFSGCQITGATFVSPTIGFVLETKVVSSDACMSCAASPVALFATKDGGTHWLELTIPVLDPCCRAAELTASADGNELLLIGSSNKSTALYYSGDGGSNWRQMGLPAGTGQAVEMGCKGSNCITSTIQPLVYFNGPRDGWVFSQEQSFNVADLYRTTDAGADWTFIGKVDLYKEFGLNLAYGAPPGTAIYPHDLVGQLAFSNGSLAWFAAQPTCISDLSSSTWHGNQVFRSIDGGLSWTPTDLSPPAGLTGSGWVTASMNFFDVDHGVLELVVQPRSCDPQSGSTLVEHRFVYMTANGGKSWSDPVSVPQPALYAEMRYIDARHWVGWPYGGGWISTSDAGQHWSIVQGAGQFGDAPAAGHGLPPQLPADYPLRRPFGFVDDADGWALPYATAANSNARGVALYLTSDFGQTWRPAALPELK